MVNAWEEKNKTQLAKGNLGEGIVDDHLHSIGYSVYRPQRTDRAHPFDRVAFRRINNEWDYYIVEVKTKPHRYAYPDTGFDYKQYKVYLASLEQMPVYVFWVDENKSEIYGNHLKALSEPRIITHRGHTIKYPLITNGIVYFPLVAMKTIAKLTALQCNEIRQYTKSNFKAWPSNE